MNAINLVIIIGYLCEQLLFLKKFTFFTVTDSKTSEGRFDIDSQIQREVGLSCLAIDGSYPLWVTLQGLIRIA